METIALDWRIDGDVNRSGRPYIVFSFYNDQLFRVVVDYSQDWTAGMTDADIIEAISTLYGPLATRPSGASESYHGSRRGAGLRSPGGEWGDAVCAVVLYRSLCTGRDSD